MLLAVAYLYERLRGGEGIGGGDIKLLGWLGAVLGFQAIPYIVIASSFFGLFGGLFFAIKSGKGLKTALPFGPFISAAAVMYMFFYFDISIDFIPLPFVDWSAMSGL